MNLNLLIVGWAPKFIALAFCLVLEFYVQLKREEMLKIECCLQSEGYSEVTPYPAALLHQWGNCCRDREWK